MKSDNNGTNRNVSGLVKPIYFSIPVTNRKEKKVSMTKFSLAILMVLSNNGAETPSKALSIPQILSLMDEKERKAYSTAYRHLGNMKQLGYVKSGLPDKDAVTYLITESGKLFCNAQF